MKNISVSELRRNLAKVLQNVVKKHDPVVIQHHGKDVAAVVPTSVLERLRDYEVKEAEEFLRTSPSLASVPAAEIAGVALEDLLPHMGAEELEIDFDQLVADDSPREQEVADSGRHGSHSRNLSELTIQLSKGNTTIVRHVNYPILDHSSLKEIAINMLEMSQAIKAPIDKNLRSQRRQSKRTRDSLSQDAKASAV